MTSAEIQEKIDMELDGYLERLRNSIRNATIAQEYGTDFLRKVATDMVSARLVRLSVLKLEAELAEDEYRHARAVGKP